VETIELVCLCEQFDIRAEFGRGFDTVAPWIRPVRPDEVSDPVGVRHAMVFRPGPNAFHRFPNLKLLCSIGAGVDALVAHPGLRPDMVLTRMTAPEVAEMMTAFALWHVIGWHRQMHLYPVQQAARVWREHSFVAPSAFAVTVLGYGNVGRALCDALARLGYAVTAFAASPKPDATVPVITGEKALDGLFETSRAVVNVLPLTPKTVGIISAGRLSRMRDDAILVQIGRGPHLDDAALLAALDAGRPAFAAIDVTAPEPTSPDHPFWSHPKVLLTPHVASIASPQTVAASILRAIEQFERGAVPPGAVDIARGY
jgi:glyoxylate/hydroxypyruvate reductase